MTGALLERCWDERLGLFVNLAGPDERRSRVRTIHGLMPLDPPRPPGTTIADRLVEHLGDPRTFARPYPVPSVALDEPTFIRDHRLRGFRFIWRGPFSLNTNWFLVHGLRGHGYDDVADRIAEPLARGRRARRLQRVLRPAGRHPGRRRALRLGDPRRRSLDGRGRARLPAGGRAAPAFEPYAGSRHASGYD